MSARLTGFAPVRSMIPSHYARPCRSMAKLFSEGTRKTRRKRRQGAKSPNGRASQSSQGIGGDVGSFCMFPARQFRERTQSWQITCRGGRVTSTSSSGLRGAPLEWLQSATSRLMQCKTSQGRAVLGISSFSIRIAKLDPVRPCGRPTKKGPGCANLRAPSWCVRRRERRLV